MSTAILSAELADAVPEKLLDRVNRWGMDPTYFTDGEWDALYPWTLRNALRGGRLTTERVEALFASWRARRAETVAFQAEILAYPTTIEESL